MLQAWIDKVHHYPATIVRFNDLHMLVKVVKVEVINRDYRVTLGNQEIPIIHIIPRLSVKAIHLLRNLLQMECIRHRQLRLLVVSHSRWNPRLFR